MPGLQTTVNFTKSNIAVKIPLVMTYLYGTFTDIYRVLFSFIMMDIKYPNNNGRYFLYKLSFKVKYNGYFII